MKSNDPSITKIKIQKIAEGTKEIVKMKQQI